MGKTNESAIANIKRWYILCLLLSFLTTYIVTAFIFIVVMKFPLYTMASLTMYYLSIIWIGILVITYQRYRTIQFGYKPKQKRFITRKNLLILYFIIAILLILVLTKILSNGDFGAEFAAVTIIGWLILWYGLGYLFLSDFIFERFLKTVKKNNIHIKVSIWFLVIVILIILIVILTFIPIKLAMLEDIKQGIGPNFTRKFDKIVWVKRFIAK